MAGYRGSLFLGAALAAMTIVAVPVGAQAQNTSEDRDASYAIPPQGLSGALRQFAEASGLQLVYDTQIAADKTSSGVTGTMSRQEALARILAGSALSFQISGNRAVIISAAGNSATAEPTDPDVRAVGVVNVEGVSGNMPFGEMVSPVNGTNGSRDVEATEGTGSYTTGATSIVSKVPTSLKDTPQTVSVVTSQRIEDQNLESIRDVLQSMPGITTTAGTTNEEFSVYSRGFRVTTYSYDGGAPVTYTNNSRPMLNMSEFDSVQLARGATGLFGGYGDPGGMVNLVRKKPLDHEQFAVELDGGSYNNFRQVVDYTGPLTADKSLRGRIVASHQSKNYFYDIAKSEMTSIYGVLEYDLTPKTIVTVGASGNWGDSVLNVTGLPRYSNGEAIDWPISTCLCVPGAGEDAKKLGVFANISHQISDNWSTKLNALYDYQNFDQQIIQVTADIPFGATSAGGAASGYRATNPVRQTAIDYSIIGNIPFLGGMHTLAVGANYQYVNADGGFTSYYDYVGIPDIFTWDPATYVIQNPTVKNYSAPLVRSKSYGIYGNLRFEIFDFLHASIGMRYSETTRRAIFQYDYTPDPEIVPNLKDRSTSRPNFGVNANITKNLSAYGSYQSIYQVQNMARYVLNGAIPPPITGSNAEGGLKWESPDRRVNASVAAFRIIQNGVLGADYNTNPNGEAKPLLSDTKSEGIEFEINGEVLPGWQVSANYTYNDNSFTQSNFFDSTIIVSPKASFAPRHLGKLWTTYRGAQGGPLSGVILGAGANVVSKSFQSTQFCVFNPDFSFSCTPYDFVTKGYMTFSAQAGYQLSKNIGISLNVNNVTNKKTYIATNQQQTSAYNYYLEPRSFVASLRLKW